MSGLLWAAFVLGLVNAFIRPVLWLLTFPLTVLTFGLFALVVNAFTLWLSAAMVAYSGEDEHLFRRKMNTLPP